MESMVPNVCDHAEFINGVSETREERKRDSDWDDGATSLMLDRYQEYLKMVGPMKTFKRKKDMWEAIRWDLKNTINVERTALQYENRYKTVMKRKKFAVDNNSTSGSSRMPIPFEVELSAIAATDDSIEPEVRMDAAHSVLVEKPQPLNQRRKSSDITKLLTDLHEKKEAARERRHQEKMAMMDRFIAAIEKK